MQIFITPQMLEKKSLSSFDSSSPGTSRQKKLKLKGYDIKKAGFQIAFPSANHLNQFNLPDLGARHPIVISVKPQSPAFKGGLMAGDLLFSG